MESVAKLDWINDYKMVEENKKEDISLEQMIQELKKQTHDYHRENELFYEKMNEQIAEVKSLLKYSLTEQEKIHIRTLNTEELSKLLLDNQLEMKKNIDYMIEKSNKIWGEK